MRETERIADQMVRAFRGEAWHGPALLEVLDGITAEQAANRPAGSAHSIWEIVLHLSATHNEVLERLHGNARTLMPEEDWPPVEMTGSEAWQQTINAMIHKWETLRKAVMSVRDSDLETSIAEGFSSYYITIHGLIQHDLYHAGQIALLKKL